MILGERVGDSDAAGTWIARGYPQPLRLVGVGEAPTDDLVETEVAHRVLGAAAQSLVTPQSTGLPSRPRQGRGQVLVESVDARHLLDQVDLPGDVVVAVGRHLDEEGVGVGGDSEA